MFTANNIRDVAISDEAPYARALVDKLLDIDRNRIHATDELIVRKAVFGLLEVIAELEQRLIAVEGPQAQADRSARLSTDLGTPTPDQLRLGE